MIPKKLHDKVVELVHQEHHGIVKIKHLTREKVWFPGIDALVKKRVKSCQACQASTHPLKLYMEPQKVSKLPDGPKHDN